jgi:hypothetical protein
MIDSTHSTRWIKRLRLIKSNLKTFKSTIINANSKNRWSIQMKFSMDITHWYLNPKSRFELDRKNKLLFD